MSDIQTDNAEAQAPATEVQTAGTAAAGTGSAGVSAGGPAGDVAAPAAVTGTMAVQITDEQLAQLAQTFATPPVATPAPAPAISDAQMRAAADALTNGARMYHGMLDAAAALYQVSSLGAAVSERQSALNSLDTSINDSRARLAALEQMIQTQIANSETTVQTAMQTASDRIADATAQASAIVAAAQASAADLNTQARAKAAELLDQANATATAVQMQTATEQQTINDLKAQQATLQGQVNDLETNIAVAKANLRQLLGD